VAPKLVAYRDGFDTTGKPVPWTMATGDLKMVTFMAHDAYSITVVCEDDKTVLTWQSLRTVADDKSDTVKEPVIDTPCTNPPPTPSQIKVKMVQPGFVHLGDADDQTTNAGDVATLSVLDGTFDLVATTNLADASMNTTAIRRDVTITNGQPQTLTDIDASMGLAQVPLMLSLDNAPDPMKSTETVEATVNVTTKNNTGSALVSHAKYDLDKQDIKLYGLPSDMLTPDDSQSATFTGTNHVDATHITTTRTITKPFATGDDTATGMAGFTLPPRISVATWGMDADRLSVALPTLPSLDSLTIKTSGTSMDGAKTAKYEIDITSGYFDDTSLARPVFDTTIPGFQDAWKINFKLDYSRQITSEHDVFDDGVFVQHETSQFLQDVPPPKTPTP
jgi:hypothetical protein